MNDINRRHLQSRRPHAQRARQAGVRAATALPISRRKKLMERRKKFVDEARNEMLRLFRQRKDYIGSQSPNRNQPGFKKRTVIHCSKYVALVLQSALKATNRPKTADQVYRVAIRSGVELTKALTTKYNWNAVYFNSDVNHPADGDWGHIATYVRVKRSNVYRVEITRTSRIDVKVDDMIVDFRPTPTNSTNYKKFTNKKWNVSQKPTVQKRGKYDEFKKIKFAIGFVKGGVHTFLFSYGKVYEVHWDKVGGHGLFEVSDFDEFVTRAKTYWTSGVLAIPPGSQ